MPCRVVLWPRIDQKTCLKAVVSAGFQAVVVNNAVAGDEVGTDLGALEEEVLHRGAPAVACIVTTTSCFAPRSADNIIEVVRILTLLELMCRKFLSSRICAPAALRMAGKARSRLGGILNFMLFTQVSIVNGLFAGNKRAVTKRRQSCAPSMGLLTS